MSTLLNRVKGLALLTKLAEAWPQYRDMGHLLAQRSLRDSEFERRLLVDSRIAPGDLLKNFTGVLEIRGINDNEIEFIDLSGERLFATFEPGKVPMKVVAMKAECPECFGDPQQPPCGICEGTGRV